MEASKVYLGRLVSNDAQQVLGVSNSRNVTGRKEPRRRLLALGLSLR